VTLLEVQWSKVRVALVLAHCLHPEVREQGEEQELQMLEVINENAKNWDHDAT